MFYFVILISIQLIIFVLCFVLLFVRCVCLKGKKFCSCLNRAAKNLYLHKRCQSSCLYGNHFEFLANWLMCPFYALNSYENPPAKGTPHTSIEWVLHKCHFATDQGHCCKIDKIDALPHTNRIRNVSCETITQIWEKKYRFWHTIWNWNTKLNSFVKSMPKKWEFRFTTTNAHSVHFVYILTWGSAFRVPFLARFNLHFICIILLIKKIYSMFWYNALEHTHF